MYVHVCSLNLRAGMCSAHTYCTIHSKVLMRDTNGHPVLASDSLLSAPSDISWECYLIILYSLCLNHLYHFNHKCCVLYYCVSTFSSDDFGMFDYCQSTFVKVLI